MILVDDIMGYDGMSDGTDRGRKGAVVFAWLPVATCAKQVTCT